VGPADDSRAELRAILTRLADPDPARQEAAVRELRDRASGKGLTASDGAFLLRAAGDEYPPIKDNPTNCVAAELIRAVASTPDRSYVAIVREIFDSLRPPPRPFGLGDPRTAALDLLASMDDEGAAQALLDLLEESVAAGSPLSLPVGSLRGKPRLAQVYFPRMLRSATGQAASDVFQVCFEYARKRFLPPEHLAPYAGVLVDAYARLRPVIDGGQSKWACGEGEDDGNYGEVRGTAGLLLDLMGYFPSPDVEPVLSAATKLADLTLAGYAAIALLRLGRNVDVAVLERLAARPEKRSWLYGELGRSRRRELFPPAWATQTALAEGVMVRWLVHPNELGRPPDEIELVKVFVDDGPPDGVLEWYLFRFRTHPPHWASEKGWMTGLAGPFKRAGGPTTADYGCTWSDFTPWDSMTPEQHLEGVRETIGRFRQSRSEAGA
jgi:hypothetical protein